MSVGKQPDFNVSVMNKETQEKNNRIGAAWTNDDGSIRIKIDPFVVIHGGPDINLTLWPNDGQNRGRTARAPGPASGGSRGGENDDIPF